MSPTEPEPSTRTEPSGESHTNSKVTWKDLQHLLTGHLQHESETAYYILLSMLDFFLTYTLLTNEGRGGVSFGESNPVAAWFLDHYGIVKGLLGFKLTMVVFVCCVAQLVSLKKPRLGRLVLWLGIAVTLWVVVYSARLLIAAW